MKDQLASDDAVNEPLINFSHVFDVGIFENTTTTSVGNK